MMSFALMATNKLPESFYSFIKCGSCFEGRKDLQTMEVNTFLSPLLFTEVSGSVAILTDKAQRWEFFRGAEESHSTTLNTNGSSS